MNNIKINTKTNLLGDPTHKSFLQIQTVYGIAQRGGIAIATDIHATRIVSDVNLLSNSEVKNLIFNETIFSN